MPAISHMPGATNGFFYTKRRNYFFDWRSIFKALLHWNQLRADGLTCCCGNPAFCCLPDLGGGVRHGRLILVHVRPKMVRATAYFLWDEERSTHAAETKNKTERREVEVSKNEERKEGSWQEQESKEGERLYYNSTQLVHFTFNFSLYVRSTDSRDVPMTCDLHAEQRKRDSGKKYERREEQRIRPET
jgi:hypothetical protein